jgi:glycosyltransferase involved in cell wall biosynthesis
MPLNVLVWHWGREEARYTFELFRALRTSPHLNVVLSCSKSSHLHNAARQLDGALIEPIITFFGTKRTSWGKVSGTAAIVTVPFTMLRFRRILRKHRIDVVIGAQNSIWDFASMPSLALEPSLRYVQVMHEVVSHPGENYPLRGLVPIWQVAIADGIIVLSDEIRRHEIIGRCPVDRIWKMPHGTLSYGSQRPEAAVHPRGAHPLRLLFFGRINPYKGLDRLLAAMPLLRARGLPFKLVIAGAGDLSAYREQLRAPDIEVHNRWLSDEELASFLRSSDLVVLPYSLSSQSGVAATAYTVGRPVVATPIGGLKEQVLPTTGLLARNMTPEAFAESLTTMICDPVLFDQCAAGSLDHAQTELNWSKSTSVLNEVIQKVRAMPRRRWTQSMVGRPRIGGTHQV